LRMACRLCPPNLTLSRISVPTHSKLIWPHYIDSKLRLLYKKINDWRNVMKKPAVKVAAHGKHAAGRKNPSLRPVPTMSERRKATFAKLRPMTLGELDAALSKIVLKKTPSK
jgi:hypothetical protein